MPPSDPVERFGLSRVREDEHGDRISAPLFATWTPSLADVLARLDPSLPTDRVLIQPIPGTATSSDVETIQNREDRLCELVDGVLVEKTIGSQESFLTLRFSYFLMSFTEPRNLGSPLGPDGMIRFAPNLVLIPDVAFFLKERLPDGKMPAEGILSIIPDFVIEVISPGNTRAEMDRKLGEYFAAGVRLIWYVDPSKRIVWVYEGVDRVTCLDESGILDGGTVLPGFTLKISDWLK